MKKIPFYFLIAFIFINILFPLSVVFSASTWSYTAPNTKNNLGDISKNTFSSQEECNTERNAYMNSEEYKKNHPAIYLTPTECTEEKDPVIVDPNKTITPTANDKYTFLAPLNEEKIAPDEIGTYFNWIFKIAIGLCAALAVIMIVISGIQYMGDESIFSKTESKSKITSAVLGLLIALGSYALLNTINPDLLGKSLKIKSVSAVIISNEDTSTGSSTSLCLSTKNPPDHSVASGTTLNLSPEINNEYLVELKKISNLSKGAKLLITAQTAVEGFKSGTKSYRTNNPGNIGNTDDGSTKTFPTLLEGIKAQQSIINNVATNQAKSYKIGSKPTCALGDEAYEGYLYQYLRIYATGARVNNNYLNAIIGYFKANGININSKTTISEIYNMN